MQSMKILLKTAFFTLKKKGLWIHYEMEETFS